MDVYMLSHLVISFTEELESLGSLVHEDTIQVASLHRPDLYGLLPPTHDLVGTDVCCREIFTLINVLVFQKSERHFYKCVNADSCRTVRLMSLYSIW